VIMATGRSDHPNQVNNVLGFPFIFRGALDVRATKINEEMKMAAVRALADLTREPVPEQVNIAYDTTRLAFGKEYIIPKPFDPRLITKIPPAVAKAAMESGVAKAPIQDWKKYVEELYQRSGNDNKVVRLMHNRARMNPKRIVFAEAELLDVMKAAQIVHEEGIAIPILLGNREIIEGLKKELDFDAEVEIIDPRSEETKEVRTRYAMKLWESRKRKGETQYSARINMGKRNYFGAMMLLEGDADGMISGYSRSYPKVLKPVFEVLGRAKGVANASTVNIMITDRGPLFLADTSINVDPNAEELAEIAQMTANVAGTFGFNPVMALLSYANYGSSSHPNARKVREAVRILHERNPDLVVDGEIQTDFALDQDLCHNNFPFSKLAGKKVNTLIFPNLDSANITYKLLKGLHNAESIGPIMVGLRRSAHILQLGASVDEMVNMAAVAVIDAQEREKRRMAHMQGED
ncbi:MAG: phosphate acyltransferase, partial [Allomuricauda sp.]